MHFSPLLLAILLGVPALVVLAYRLLPGVRLSIWLLRDSRGRRGERSTDVALAAAFQSLLPPERRSAALDDRTWQDLDLDQVFLSLDRTESAPGQQYLYHLLRTPQTLREPLERLERAIRRVAGDPALAGRVRGALRTLDDPRAARLAHLIFSEVPGRPRFWWMFPLLTAGSLACLAGIAYWPSAIVVWAIIATVNISVQLYYKTSLAQFVPALHEVPAFLRVSVMLGALEVEELADESRRLSDGAARLDSLSRATQWLMFEPGQTNDLAASVYEYVNLLFLFDVNAFVFATETLRGSRERLRAMFEAIGYIDAVQSIAAWRDDSPVWTTPEFTEARKELHVEALVHPLLTEPVPNSLEVENAGILVTGSNMSGKTTFVRAMGVNAVLAQTLNTVCAKVWRAPMLHVRTSIGRSDSLIEGKSYYLAEVESVGALVRAKETGAQHLFLLDEIFRGTNTTERVAAAYAVLSFLNRGTDLVIVATHDIEVIDLLGDAYDAHHFREEIAGGAVAFDYRIHDGPSSTRNAIALLQLMGYPEDLVADALAALDWRQRLGDSSAQPSTSVVSIPHDQLFYRSPEGRARLERAAEDIRLGRVTRTNGPDEAQEFLDSLRTRNVD
jgi:hypothetical protein